MLHVERDILRGLTAEQFRDWELYHSIDPIGDERGDYQTASVVQMLYNINRGKDSKPGKLDEFVLKWSEEVQTKPKQTWQQQVQIMKVIAAAYSGGESTTPPPAPTPMAEEDKAELERVHLLLEKARKAMR